MGGLAGHVAAVFPLEAARSHTFLRLAQVGGGSSGPTTMIFFGGLLVIMYFLIIAPQQKQAKQQKALIASLKKGDEVLTQSGLLGRIHSVTDKTVLVEIANGVRVQMLKSAIQAKTGSEGESAAPADKAEKEAK